MLLAFLGEARTHLQSFNLFLAVVLGLAVATVVVFVLTAEPDARARRDAESR